MENCNTKNKKNEKQTLFRFCQKKKPKNKNENKRKLIKLSVEMMLGLHDTRKTHDVRY